MKVVYATTNARIMLPSGIRGQIVKGTHWPADDPVVEQHPQYFSADPRWGLFYSTKPEGYDAPIEQATAAPGEKRAARRAVTRG